MAHDSLFGSDDDSDAWTSCPEPGPVAALDYPPAPTATATCPPIRGLHVFRALITLELQELLLRSILAEGAVSRQHPQAMLFPRLGATKRDADACPAFLRPLVLELPGLLKPLLSALDYDTVFNEARPMQTILNLYEPGHGITPHVR